MLQYFYTHNTTVVSTVLIEELSVVLMNKNEHFLSKQNIINLWFQKRNFLSLRKNFRLKLFLDLQPLEFIPGGDIRNLSTLSHR